jgi:hypothetical protein
MERGQIGGTIRFRPQATRSLRGAKRSALNRLIFLRLWQSGRSVRSAFSLVGFGGGLVQRKFTVRQKRKTRHSVRVDPLNAGNTMREAIAQKKDPSGLGRGEFAELETNPS